VGESSWGRQNKQLTDHHDAAIKTHHTGG